MTTALARKASRAPDTPAIGSDALAGVDEGVRTMREGGRRVMIMPPELAFGEESEPPNMVRRAVGCKRVIGVPTPTEVVAGDP